MQNTIKTIKETIGDFKYEIIDDRLIIDSSLNLYSLKSCDKDFLKNTTINGYLDLYSLQSCDKDFLKNTTINGYLSLYLLGSCDKDFLQNTTINGGLDLYSLKSCDKDFLKDTTINGDLYLDSLASCDKDFLKGTTINGWLHLSSLKSCDKDFLKDTTINGGLDLRSLKSCDKKILNENVSRLSTGYNKEKSYCFFDGILSKVISKTIKNGYTIYKSPFEYIIQKDSLTAHSKTVKQGIIDVKFKEYVSTLKHSKLSMIDEVSVELYRAFTGACYGGIESWLKNNKIPYKMDGNKPILSKKLKVKDVYDILKKTNAYGFKRFQELVKN
jgi:hypothetical protein